MASCPSWLHDEPVPTIPGRRTCAAHVDEEPHIIRIEGELERVAEQVRGYEHAAAKHPDEAKAFLESAIRWFFDQELEPAGYHAIQGFRRDTELDIIATVDAGEREDWNIHFEVQRRVERAHVVLHLEVAYRSSRHYRKVRDSIVKLNESIDQNIAQGRGLPWTGLVLLGPGWLDSDAAVMQVVHTAYHARSTERIDHAGAGWLPFVDAVVMPGVLYKKHDAFEDLSMVGRRRPIMMPAPCAPDPFRPLALARGFVMHRLRVLAGGVTPESEAWPDHLTAAISGCVSRIAAGRALDSLRAVLMDCHHDAAPALYHMASAYPRAMCYPMPLEFEDKTCVSNGRYSMRIRPLIWSAGRPTSEVRPSRDRS
ncbi:MAG: hypothetical protein KIT31_05505 [Deltaproteobacteria bacterium]|nr:hypothetical protein [Deltaproteobacteria bacterium]